MAFFRRASDDDQERKILRVGLMNPVERLHPRQAQDIVSVLVLTQVFEPPYHHPSGDESPPPFLFDGALRPESGDGDRYSAALKSGLTFSDGTPVTPEHVVSSLMKAENFREQATATAEGGRVHFSLERPNPRFELVLTQMFCAVVLEKGDELFGTGPFVVDPTSTPEQMRLNRNPHYREEIGIDEIHFDYYPPGENGSPDALVAALESGEVDFTISLPRDAVAKVQRVRKWFQPGNSTACLYFNVEKPHLQDSRVRRALAQAIDRSALTKLCYENPLAFTATSLLPPVMGSFRDAIRFDPDRSRQLLRESGTSLPELELLIVWGPRPYIPQPKAVAGTIVDQLSELGVRVRIHQTGDSLEFYERAASREHDLALVGWIADTADPADFFECNLSSELTPEPGKSPAIRANMGHWKDPETDEALDRFRRQPTDENKREVLKIVRDRVPLLPIMYGPTIAVHGWNVKSFEPTAVGLPRLEELEIE